MGRLVIVSRQNLEIEVTLLDHHIIRQLACLGMAFELQIELVKLDNILELSEVSVEQSAGRILIVNTEV